MPNYRVEVHKSVSGYHWNNDYIIGVDSDSAAGTLGTAIANWERTLHQPQVLIEYARISTVAHDGRHFDHVAINANGTAPNDRGEMLFLTSCLRVDFNSDWTTPGRKYYRGVLTEGVVNFDAVANNGAGFAALIGNLMALFTVNSGSLLIGKQFHTVMTAQVYGKVASRSLHRHRRKKLTTTP